VRRQGADPGFPAFALRRPAKFCYSPISLIDGLGVQQSGRIVALLGSSGSIPHLRQNLLNRSRVYNFRLKASTSSRCSRRYWRGPTIERIRAVLPVPLANKALGDVRLMDRADEAAVSIANIVASASDFDSLRHDPINLYRHAEYPAEGTRILGIRSVGLSFND
jgi:hypothetical protein